MTIIDRGENKFIWEGWRKLKVFEKPKSASKKKGEKKSSKKIKRKAEVHISILKSDLMN